MDYWRTRVYQLTEENFIPWFSSYWTQEWLSMKVSWYTISAKGEQDASAKRLAALSAGAIPGKGAGAGRGRD